jgi:hypothetical protein
MTEPSGEDDPRRLLEAKLIELEGISLANTTVITGLMAILRQKGLVQIDETNALIDGAMLLLEEMGLSDPARKSTHLHLGALFGRTPSQPRHEPPPTIDKPKPQP